MLDPASSSSSFPSRPHHQQKQPSISLSDVVVIEEEESQSRTPSISISIEQPSRKLSSITIKSPSDSRKPSLSPTSKNNNNNTLFSAVSKFMTLDSAAASSAGRRLSQLFPHRSSSSALGVIESANNSHRNSSSNGKRSMSSRLSAAQMSSLRRFSGGTKKDNHQGSTMSSGRSLLAATIRAKFRHDSQDEESDPLVKHLDKYTTEELDEYRQVFNMFDADRSGAIGLDELENAIANLGMDPKTVDLESVIKEADKRGNHQIDFDEFCEVMQTMTEKNRNWIEIIRECFAVFDRSESGMITRKDFEFILREMGGFENALLIDDLFTEFDVDSDGFIDYDEFGFLVKNYLTDDDIS